MKRPLIYLLMLGATAVSAQTWKSKSIDVPTPSYAEYPAPEGIHNYTVELANIKGAGVHFTNDDLKRELSLQNFEAHDGSNTTPDLFFAVNGVKVEDIDITVKRSQKQKLYWLSVLPTEKTSISVLTMAKGENVHYQDFRINARLDESKKPIPVSLEISEAEIEKYLIISEGGNQFKGTPYLVQEYLKEHLGDSFLKNLLVPTIQESYDNRVDLKSKTFYWIKDKKNKALEADTKNNLALLEETMKSLNTLEKLRANHGELKPFKDFWTQQLGNFDVSNKDGKKVSWGILMNLYRLSLMEEDFTAAKNYLDQIVALDYKKWATSTAKSGYKSTTESYAANYDEAGSQKYAAAYEVDAILAKIAKNDAVKNNNVKDAPGYVLTKDGEKMEGKISLRFSPEEQTGGNIVDLSGDTTAKRVYVKYVNEKGKNKTKTYKCKDVAEIVVDNKVYESVTPKKSILDTSDDALGLSLNNTVFMERIYSSDAIKLYKDLTTTTGFYFGMPNVKKAQKANAEFFASCTVLAERIQNGEFTETEEDQKKIASFYSQNCGQTK